MSEAEASVPYRTSEPITAPVLLMVFNRPEKTQQVFDALRRARPTKLYVAADAPRANREDDSENCAKVREIVSKVDWPCEVKCLFHEKNLGCSLAGKAAWDWVFSQESELIFVEDDGLVSTTFFWFCQELLRRYRDVPKVAYIGGVNYGPKYGDASYFFSRLPAATYAMATWKRVYDLYEYKMESYPSYRTKRDFKNNFLDRFAYYYYRRYFDKYVTKGGNTYDIQMNYLVYKHSLYSIVPNVNLVSNIGLDYGGANNNMDPKSRVAQQLGNRARFEIDEIRHPATVGVDDAFEAEYFRVRVMYGKSRVLYVLDLYFRKFFGPLYRATVKRALKWLFGK